MKFKYFIKRIFFLFVFLLLLFYFALLFYSCYFGYIQSELLGSKWYLKEIHSDSLVFDCEMKRNINIQLKTLQLQLFQNNQFLSFLSLSNWSFISSHSISFPISSLSNTLYDLSTLQSIKIQFDSYSIGRFDFSLKEDVHFLSFERCSQVNHSNSNILSYISFK